MNFDFTNEPGRKLLNRQLNIDAEILISIVTPYYNAGKYFEQTFNCVMNQTFPWFEWIIIDDGSNNAEDIRILNEFSMKDKRIKIYNKENGGIASARNLGVHYSKSDIIIPLDADDLIVPTYLECNYWALFYNPEASWSYPDCLGFQGQEYLWKKRFSAEKMKWENILVCTAAIRKNALEEIGCYEEVEKYYNEDWRVWLKLLSKSQFPVHLGFYGFWYRRIDNGVLSIVKNDSKIANKSKMLIEEASESVDTQVKAKEYPCMLYSKSYTIPTVSGWDKRIFKYHDKINVMMLIPWMEMGGADLFNLDIVKRINKDIFEMSIITTVPGENSWRQKFEEYVTDVFELPSFLDIENYPNFISYFIKSREIDVIFLSNSYYGYYLVPWIRKEFPHIAIIDCVHAETKFWRSGGYVRTSSVNEEIIDKTVVSNICTKDSMVSNYGKDSNEIRVIYTGVDKEYFDPSIFDCINLNLKKEYKIDEDRPIVLFLCRISPEKRPFLLLEIAKKARNKIDNICFLVVGDGPQFTEFKEKINEFGLKDTVYCVGRQEDTRQYYKISDISLICSLNEGLSINTFNSMQMGVPVISSDVGGQNELVNDSTGKLIYCRQSEEYDFDSRVFDEDEINDYVMAIYEILYNKDGYIKMCDSCRLRIDDKFSVNNSILELEKELMLLVNDQGLVEKRIEISAQLKKYEKLVDDYILTFVEKEKYENGNRYSYEENTKGELMRIAESKWGSRLIKLAFKMKLNKLFH